MTDGGYPAAFLERHLLTGKDQASGGGRTLFERDRDRVMYSSAFRSLADKTQVVAAVELGYMHNRLTHTLKVAQIGRSVAGRLLSEGAGMDPVLVEGACLAHDIGHPPFGHIGEEALNHAVEARRRSELGIGPDETPSTPLDGFEGNAQNLRILSRLAAHRMHDTPGLHLTRGSLLAATKYPWVRGSSGKENRKWGAYTSDEETLTWMLESRPEGTLKPIEGYLMDWADDVTYAVHDVEDWYRLGLVPLEDLFRFELPAGHRRAGHDESRELTAFLEWLEADDHWDGGDFDRQEVVAQMHYLADKVAVAEPFDGTRAAKGRLHTTVTDLITYFVDEVGFSGAGCGYDGELIVPQERRLLCEILKKLVWCYVIDRPALAAQQHGQARIVRELVEWLTEDPKRLLPRDRLDEFAAEGDLARTVADHVASLTEPMAIKLHAKLGGTDLGAITDFAAAAG